MQHKHGQPVTQATQVQATSYPGSASICKKLPRQRQHMQPVYEKGFGEVLGLRLVLGRIQPRPDHLRIEAHADIRQLISYLYERR